MCGCVRVVLVDCFDRAAARRRCPGFLVASANVLAMWRGLVVPMGTLGTGAGVVSVFVTVGVVSGTLGGGVGMFLFVSFCWNI